MCSSPITQNGLTFACKQCNDCLNRRKNEWVARAMAEKSTSIETLSITLTYNEDTQESRDASKVFRFSDVSALLKRLRRAAEYKHKISDSALRFICAGEMGGDKGRCHWHLILFANCDLLELGQWSRFGFSSVKPLSRDEKITKGKHKIRLNWSLWPAGIVTIQEPNQWGIEYAMKYALKDQFSLSKSQGTMREAKAQAYSKGCFKMSRQPPIGAIFMANRLDKMRETATLPTSVNIPVPDYKGYWYPTGATRLLYLDGLRAINQDLVTTTGRPAPQWSTLLGSASEPDQERLINGEEKETVEEEQDDFTGRIKSRQREAAARSDNATIRRQCGGISPCRACQLTLSEREFASLKKDVARQRKIVLRTNPGADPEQTYRATRKPSPYCLQRDTTRVKGAFKPLA